MLVGPPLGAVAASEVRLGDRVWASPLAASVWLIRSVSSLDGFGDVESNALLVSGAAASVLIDTPATDAQTEPVLAWAETTLRRPVHEVIVTHWHVDRAGGLGAARARGIALHGFSKTRTLAREAGRIVPEHEIRPEEYLVLSGISLEIWYPGHGHTEDNIVVWLPEHRVLDGGCFVKAIAAMGLGNVAEIDPVQWAKGIAALRKRYPRASIVVPGHGATGGKELLAHTASLFAAGGK